MVTEELKEQSSLRVGLDKITGKGILYSTELKIPREIIGFKVLGISAYLALANINEECIVPSYNFINTIIL
jgi:hypothetical protein